MRQEKSKGSNEAGAMKSQNTEDFRAHLEEQWAAQSRSYRLTERLQLALFGILFWLVAPFVTLAVILEQRKALKEWRDHNG